MNKIRYRSVKDSGKMKKGDICRRYTLESGLNYVPIYPSDIGELRSYYFNLEIIRPIK